MNTMTTSTHLRRLIATAILGALASAFAGVAAADSIVTRSVTVQYGDLNLANPQGAATLYHRIVQAARQVCELPDDAGAFSAANACKAKAITDAVAKVGRPELIAVYNANNRRPFPITVATR
jgi:UrcA family protein